MAEPSHDAASGSDPPPSQPQPVVPASMAASSSDLPSSSTAAVLPIVDQSQAATVSASADDDIDAICELLGPGGPEDQASTAPAEVDELLGALAPGPKASPLLVARTSPRLSPTLAPLDGMMFDDDIEPCLPEPTVAVPAHVQALPFTVIAKFDLRCEVDLKKVAFALRNAEYNPRKCGSITVRMLEPRVVACIRTSGSCSITGTTDLQELKLAAKKVVRLIQRAGLEEAKFANYMITTMICKASMGFPVRLNELAAKWHRNALYEPELYCGCVFRTRKPKATYLVTAGGKVMISGCRNMETVQECLRRLYPVLWECRH